MCFDHVIVLMVRDVGNCTPGYGFQCVLFYSSVPVYIM